MSEHPILKESIHETIHAPQELPTFSEGRGFCVSEREIIPTTWRPLPIRNSSHFEIPEYPLGQPTQTEENLVKNVYEAINNLATKTSFYRNTHQIHLLIFDDDTFRPVLVFNHKYMDIVKKWYDDCKLTFDIEETSYLVSEKDFYDSFADILFTDYAIVNKTRFINTYIPLLLSKYKLSFQFEHYKCIFEDTYPKKYPKNNKAENDTERKNNIIKQLNINIPEFLNINKPQNLLKKSDDNTYSADPYSSFSFPQPTKCLPVLELRSQPKITPLTKSAETMGEVKPYNFYHGSYLNPYFSSNCEIIDGALNTSYEDNLLAPNYSLEHDRIYVILHHKCLKTKVLKNPTQDERDICSKYPEFGFVDILNMTINNDEFIKYIDITFDNKHFDSIDKLNDVLLSTSKYFESCQTQATINKEYVSEEKAVKSFLSYYYDVSDNIQDRIKASTLCDMITQTIKFDTIGKKENFNSFRIRLATYLQDFGLKKKRFNDGYYYYGLKAKFNDKDRKNKNTTQELFDKIIEERKTEREREQREKEKESEIFNEQLNVIIDERNKVLLPIEEKNLIDINKNINTIVEQQMQTSII